MTSVLGAMEPVTAVCIGALIFGEEFTMQEGWGIFLNLGGRYLNCADPDHPEKFVDGSTQNSSASCLTRRTLRWENHDFPYSLLIRSFRPIFRNSLIMAFRSSGLYQKKNMRWASFSRGVLAENTGSNV